MHPSTAATLAPYGDRVRYVDVHAPGAYWELFKSLWKSGEDFIIVEHDVVVNADTIESFDACPEAWCTAPYLW